MKTYVITRKEGQLAWENVPELAIDTCQWLAPAPVQAFAQLCYDENTIYVRLRAVEPNIRAQEQGETGMPCEDSCLEFFFCPVADNRTYFNIEFNPNCCMYLGIGTDRYDLIRLLPHGNLLAPEAKCTADGWEITYQIPAAFVQRFFPEFRLVSGGMLRGNFYKCGDSTVQPHYYAWNPIEGEQADFHLSQYFGKLYLE